MNDAEAIPAAPPDTDAVLIEKMAEAYYNAMWAPLSLWEHADAPIKRTICGALWAALAVVLEWQKDHPDEE